MELTEQFSEYLEEFYQKGVRFGKLSLMLEAFEKLDLTLEQREKLHKLESGK